MDYWCALWFWPIEKAKLLPSRHEFLFEVGCVLEGTMRATEAIRPTQGQMFATEQPSLTLADQFGFVDLEALCENSERLKLVRQIAAKYRFFHWELDFADLFHDAGGFDLILGNPPWIKIGWNEGAVMGDVQPLYVLRDFNAPILAELRDKTITEHPELRSMYLSEYGEFESSKNFLSSQHNYHLLHGTQSNTFKCFIVKATELSKYCGYVHDDGMFNDPKGGTLREHLYPRLRYWFQFENELSLFEGLNDHGRMRFEVSVLGPPREVTFRAVTDVFWPSTIDKSFDHDGFGIVEGRKSDQNKWSVAGHKDRILVIDESTLDLFANLYDERETPALRARLPVLRALEMVEVLRTFAEYPRRLGDVGALEKYKTTVMWDETNSVKRDHTIRRETRFVTEMSDWILSGPHLSLANPAFQTPNEICEGGNDYELLDLTLLPEGYLPRSNFAPDCTAATYRERTPTVPWDEEKKVTDFYRVFLRRMLSQAGERTLLPAIVPTGCGHINTILSISFAETSDLIRFAASLASIPYDFFIKTTGRGDLYESALRMLPLPPSSIGLSVRILLLNSLTNHYADLWRGCWNPAFQVERWSKEDLRLRNQRFSDLTSDWSWGTPFRSDFERRQGLVEIDVLIAMAIGLTVDELCTIYRIQFPVLRNYERNTWYDRNGRIIYLDGDQGYGLPTQDWKKKRGQQRIERTVTDNTVATGPRQRTIVYEAPFDQCDREADYRTAWAEFKRRHS